MKAYFSKNLSSQGLSQCAILAKNADRDMFFCALLAPAEKRERLFQLIAFWGELQKATIIGQSYAKAGPMAGYIRLQWWHDIVSGQKERHELATPLSESLSQGLLDPEALHSMIEACEAELEGIHDWEHWQQVMAQGVGRLYQAMAESLGGSDPTMLDHAAKAGMAHACARLRRFLPRVLAYGRYPLPVDILVFHAIDRAQLKQSGLPKAVIEEIGNKLAFYGKSWLDQVKTFPLPPSAQRVPFWVAILAAKDLRRPMEPFLPSSDAVQGLRPVLDWFQVVWARLRGHL